MAKKGKLYAVGVGPGDPELLTLKAVKMIKNADVIAFPADGDKPGIAYTIAEKAVPEITTKAALPLSFPMSQSGFEKAHLEAINQIKSALNYGKSVAFLTLGDPGFYSTFSYLYESFLQNSYEVDIICGVPSFCAASAKLRVPLAQGKASAIISAGEYHSFDGTQVIMKAGARLGELKKAVKDSDRSAFLIENCGMADERSYYDIDSFPDKTGYFSLMIVK